MRNAPVVARSFRMNVERLAAGRPGHPLLLGLGAFLLLLVALSLSSGAHAASYGSIIVENGGSVTYANESIIIDGALGGPVAGGIWVTNSSTLTLSNVTLVFVNTSTGGILLENGARLFIANSSLAADGISAFTITMSGASQLTIDHGNLSSLQYPSDPAVPGIRMEEGSRLSASYSTLIAKPDARHLLEAAQSEISIFSSTTKGASFVAASTLDLVNVQYTAFGEDPALDIQGSVVHINGSTIASTGEGECIYASLGSTVVVEKTNVTTEDTGILISGGTLELRDVAVVAQGFGVAALDGGVDATNVGIFNAANSLWLRNTRANLTAVVLGGGVVRLNNSEVSVDAAGTMRGFLILESGTRLTLTDTIFDWANIAASLDSSVIPRWRPVFAFFLSLGVPAGNNVNWTVTTPGGTVLGQGTSGPAGTARGPALEGPRLVGGDFSAAQTYGLSYSDGAFNGTTTITTWGSGLIFAIYLDASLADLSFGASGIQFSPPAPAIGETFGVESRLTVPAQASASTVSARLMVDGVQVAEQSFAVTGSVAVISFNITAQAGTHLVAIEADPVGPGGRGQVDERSEWSNNWVGLWYNGSRGSPSLIKPDLIITDMWFELNPTTAFDPVTGDSVAAVVLVVHINVSNRGLTAAGGFDIGVAAGVNTSRTAVPGAAALSNITAQLTFGPYLRPIEITVHSEVDIDSEVDEGDESNNVLDRVAVVSVVVPPRAGPPLWASALALGTAGTIVAIALWGGLALWRPEKEEEELAPKQDGSAQPAKSSETSAPPAPPAAAPVAPPPQGYPPAPPPGYPMPPQMPWQPAPAYVPAQYPAPAGPSAPPAKCPRCGSSQVSYTLYPVRQVVCSSCRSIGLF